MEPNKDKLEEFFRRTLDGLDDRPAGNGWDMPSGKVWQGIEARMKDGRQKPAFLKYGLLALVVVLLFVIAYQWWAYVGKVEDLTQQVHQQVATIEELEKDLNENEMNRPAKAASDLLVKDNNRGISPNSESTAGNGANLKNRATRKIGTDHASTPFTTNLESASPRESISKASTATGKGNQLIEPASSAITSEQKATVPVNQPEQRLGAAQMKPDVANTDMEAPATVQLPLKWPELETVSPRFNSINNSATAAILLASAHNLPSPRGPHFTLNAYFSPAYSWHSVRYKTTDESTPYEKTESPELSYTAGVLGGVDVSKRWRIYSGISYQRYSQASNHTIGLRYSTDQAITDQNGDLVTTYNTDLQTSFGDAEVELRVANSSSSNEPDINEGHIFPVRFMAEERMQHLGIPMLLEYRFGHKWLAFSLKGGIVGNFLISKEMHIISVRMMHPRLMSREVDIPATRVLRNINDFTLDVQLSAGAHVSLSKRLSLTLEPTFRSNISPIFENTRLETRMFSLALNTGFLWQL